MSTESIVSIGSLIIAAVSMITSFVLQYEARKVKDLESKNRKHKGKLIKALKAIKGYQLIETKHAEAEGVDVSSYRATIRSEDRILFDKNFLSPGNIERMLTDLENEL
jgi:hypothetical protein